ncbi:mitofilin family membrane protein [Hoeflea sp.]|uniref:mitofilin family membrane protein n=1 Tax=Hoeflea sp. TaxID=1940281 RepID=UPI001992F6E7|nr:mitofilin family membrane protein [Hoeflea sp.]MBC7282457.1 hypothetical protein [Hoeflea sp.]
MSKGPTPRHSKPSKPVTIDLDATDVTPKNEDLKPKPAASGPATSASATEKTGETASGAAPSGGTMPGPDAANPAKPAETAASGRSAVPGVKAASGSDDSARPAPERSGMDTKPGAATADAKTGSTPVDAKKPETPTRDGKPGSTAASKPSTSGKSGSGLAIVAAGVLGAAIALGGGYALQMGGLLPAPGNSGDQLQALSTRLDTVSTSVETLSSQVAQSAEGDDAGMSAQLTARLDRLETGLAEVLDGGATGDPAASAALDERLAALEDRIAALGETGATAAPDPAVSAEIGEMRAAQSGLQTALADLQTRTSAQMSEMASQIAALEQGQADMAEQLGEPGRQVDLARAIAAAGLKSAIDRGGSFMAELEAFASVAPDDPAVPELRDLAASGVPSRSRLIESFPEAATTAIAAAEPGDPEAGLVDRLMSSALSVVKVRKVGDVEGDTAEAITARAEARLIDGDLDAALAEWNNLPEASRAAASEYGAALAARARAEKLIAASLAPAAAASSSEASTNEAPAN